MKCIQRTETEFTKLKRTLCDHLQREYKPNKTKNIFQSLFSIIVSPIKMYSQDNSMLSMKLLIKFIFDMWFS